MATHTKISTSVDYDRDGKQMGYLQLPHSTNESGWGSLLIPIVVVKNGDGPTVLFTGGNHGDEYEGPISLLKLARELTPESIHGRVIIMPGLNYPALLAGTRLSPIDGRNMNRCYPGDRDGTPTLIIAHYVYTVLLPMADAVLDFHSGGGSMIFANCGVIHFLDDPEIMARSVALLQAFGAPIGLVLREMEPEGLLDTAVESMGKLFLSTELGGGAFVTPQSLQVAEWGLRNMLRHLGVLEGAVETGPVRFMETPAEGAYYMAPIDGLYEPLMEVGTEVAAGTVLGSIYSPQVPEQPPATVTADIDGVLITRPGRGAVRRGDTVAVMASDLTLDLPE